MNNSCELLAAFENGNCSVFRWNLRFLWPVQVLVQKFVRTLAVNRMRPDKPLNFGLVADLQLCGIEIADLRIFVANPIVFANAVEMAAAPP